MERFYSLCLQGNINTAMDYLRPLQQNSEEIEKIKDRFYQRFFDRNFEETIAVEDEWIFKVILAYYEYFRIVLTNRQHVTIAESILTEKLNELVLLANDQDLNSIEEELKRMFAEKGYYFLGGVTPPFRGPYIWRTMETHQYEVELPSTIQPVTVHMMSNFLLESWIGFATCEQKHVGGWANSKELFCNAYAYHDLNDEQFQISYLKHEAQHLFDMNHFPHLQSKQLEYRAKLVELIYSRNYDILRKFLMEAKNDPNYPHSFAAYQIIRDLSSLFFNMEFVPNIAMWQDIDYEEISIAARSLLGTDTQKLTNVK